MKDTFTITVEEDVAIPGLENMPTYPYWQSHKRKIESMQVGDSFFVPGGTSEKLVEFVEYARQMGHLLLPRDTINDEIYLAPGVRVWCVSQAQLDTILERDKQENRQTPHPRTAAREAMHRWWRSNKSGKVIQTQPNAGPPHGEEWFKVPESAWIEQERKRRQEEEEDDEL